MVSRLQIVFFFSSRVYVASLCLGPGPAVTVITILSVFMQQFGNTITPNLVAALLGRTAYLQTLQYSIFGMRFGFVEKAHAVIVPSCTQKTILYVDGMSRRSAATMA